ncbi:MAG: DUF1566 domain-containing protein [Campylobacterota bacterium]|nr:DUF1566 domain-containing protein [Campylobacterota bacterium]
MPSFNELFSIVDMTKYTPSISDTFINTANSKYWTSTTSKATTSTIYDDVWTIDFNTSKTYQSDSKTLELNLRCVRGN